MTKRWFLFSLLCITACLPQPKSDVQKAKAELLIEGRVLHSSELLSGSTAIFIEQEPVAEAISADDGSFALTLDEDRLEALRLQYGLQDALLHLYFISENGNPESAVLNVLNIKNRGAMNLGDIQLQTEVPVEGRIVAQGTPAADARVRLGRKEIQTAADGTFSLTLPAQSATPLLVEKRGFVQTRGTWLPGNQLRDVELYSDLNPMGSIEAQPIPRNTSNQPISLSYSANGAARWIRFANNPDILNQGYIADAPWQDLRQPLQIMPAAATIYFQFADRDQKILGPVLSYTPTLLME
ncbi:MAG TPA: hypothetical protein VFO10_28510 [Oligoflexus sp.]|uniref:hypothetical protein n=1 Tax=Oligoflexus sp. TaxID=1971216 RepID=UPI002D7F8BE4|nr:hypothetical protein [Oligoflexus sp.]HET9241241.1 hypothetical protein [Oligoflexus sp.]